jgi:hypothetical protein
MATLATILRVDDLPTRQLSALKRKAQRLGLTPAKYVRQLIEDDLALDRNAQSTSFEELAKPFRKRFEGTSEEEIDRLVDEARGKRRSNPITSPAQSSAAAHRKKAVIG